MKALILTQEQWKNVSEQIIKNHPRSVWLSRDKMKRVLGFTPRKHTDWEQEDYRDRLKIHLDFFDEQQRTMFLLKYGDWIREEVDHS